MQIPNSRADTEDSVSIRPSGFLSLLVAVEKVQAVETLEVGGNGVNFLRTTDQQALHSLRHRRLTLDRHETTDCLQNSRTNQVNINSLKS